MKYIHGGYIKGKIAAGAIVKIVFGCILLFFTLLCFVGMAASSSEDEVIAAAVYCLLFFAPGAFLLLFFGMRALIKSAKGYPRHNLAVKLARVEPYTVSLSAFKHRTLRSFLQGDSLAAKSRLAR